MLRQKLISRCFYVLLLGLILLLVLVWLRGITDLNNALSRVNRLLANHEIRTTCNRPSDEPGVTNYRGPLDMKATIPQSEPASYVGPVVEGWPPLAKRLAGQWFRPDAGRVLLAPQNLNNDGNWCHTTRLLICQHSRPSNFQTRMDSRDTWMQFSKEFPEVKVLFVVGRPQEDKAAEIQNKLEEEHAQFGDILQVDYLEHFNNNTLKTMYLLKYLFSLPWNSHEPEFIMKSDDDIYVNVPQLHHFLFKSKELHKSKAPGSLWPPLMGAMFITPPILEIPANEMNNSYTNYLINPSYMYSRKSYPSFVSGSAYLVPRWILPCLYEQAQQLPYFHIEDVFFTGFVADRCLAPKKHLDTFSFGRKELSDIKASWDIVVHYMYREDKLKFNQLVWDDFNLPIK